MKVRHIKTRLFARLARFGRPITLTNAGPRGQEPRKVTPIAIPTPQVKVVRKKDLEVVGWFSEMEAQAVIAKAKAQKKATLVIA